MKLTALRLASFVFFAAAATTAAGQQTGKSALETLEKAPGGATAKVMSVSGLRGQEQPDTWRVIARDPKTRGAFREYIVRNSKIVQVAPLPAEAATGLPLNPLTKTRVKFDSTQAFWRADQAAKKAKVGFDSADYELRNAEYTETPVWLVTLADQSGAAVGEVAVSAETGNLLRQAWFDAARPQTGSGLAANDPRRGQVGTPQSGQPGIGQRAQQVWEGTRQGIETGKEAVKTGFHKATDTVGGWINKARQGSVGAPSRDNNPPSWENGTYDSTRR